MCDVSPCPLRAFHPPPVCSPPTAPRREERLGGISVSAEEENETAERVSEGGRRASDRKKPPLSSLRRVCVSSEESGRAGRSGQGRFSEETSRPEPLFRFKKETSALVPRLLLLSFAAPSIELRAKCCAPSQRAPSPAPPRPLPPPRLQRRRRLRASSLAPLLLRLGVCSPRAPTPRAPARARAPTTTRTMALLPECPRSS